MGFRRAGYVVVGVVVVVVVVVGSEFKPYMSRPGMITVTNSTPFKSQGLYTRDDPPAKGKHKSLM